MENKIVSILALETDTGRLLATAPADVRAGDVVEYTAADTVVIRKVVSAICVPADDPVYSWINEAFPYVAARKVIGVYRADLDAMASEE